MTISLFSLPVSIAAHNLPNKLLHLWCKCLSKSPQGSKVHSFGVRGVPVTHTSIKVSLDGDFTLQRRRQWLAQYQAELAYLVSNYLEKGELCHWYPVEVAVEGSSDS